MAKDKPYFSIIPPVLFLICILLMIMLHFVLPLIEIIPNPYNYVGILFIVIGLWITVCIQKLFAQKDTEIHTFKQPRKLVTEGLFKISRNPIYLGFTISLIGVWLLLGTLLPLLGCISFVVVTDLWYIPFEEKNMIKEFGSEYESYKTKVRRWI